jgi:hypothetical protein
MKEKGITQKSDAIRQALHEAVARAKTNAACDFRGWLGLGLKAPLNSKPR